jgi:hypothetical protein
MIDPPFTANQQLQQQQAIAVPWSIQKVSLEIPLMKPEQLYPTPSMSDNLSYDVEFDLRLIGCELIQTGGRLLKLSQVNTQTHFFFFFFPKIIQIFFSPIDRNGHGSSSLSSLLLH